MDTVVAVATATKAREYKTGLPVYKPSIRYKGATLRKSEICHQAGYREQGWVFDTREEAIACAQAVIDERRAQVVQRAAKYRVHRDPERVARYHRHLQAEFLLWGGTGDVYEVAAAL